MVTINFTLVVLLVMFLGFLWAVQRFIFQPLLALMDARDDQVADDKRTATETGAEAAKLEDQYGAKIAHMHQEASLHLNRARRHAQEEHNAHVAAFKAKAEQEIKILNQSLAADIEAQKDQFLSLAQDIQGTIATKLELE
ncbi:MAG: ATP synthase F0 subunit B [Candidatus Hydrogenedentes bacterium]|nr:ATP synthase F0 subunit B [Candidatus Hydrogenedentota bacterium]